MGSGDATADVGAVGAVERTARAESVIEIAFCAKSGLPGAGLLVG